MKVREVQEKLLGTKKKLLNFWDINNQFKKKSAPWVPKFQGGGGHPNSGNAQI